MIQKCHSEALSQDGPRINFNQNTSKTVTLLTRTRLWRESRDDDVDADVDIIIKNNTRKTFWCQVHPFSDRRFENKTELFPALLWRGTEKQKNRC
jgi:hypothetical protein